MSNLESRVVIMQHQIESQLDNGGPATGLKLLLDSDLSKHFEFVPLIQFTNLKSFFRLFFDLYSQVKKIKPEIVHVRGLQSMGFVGLIAARLAGCKKIVVSVHGSSIDSIGIGRLKLILYKYIVEPFTLRNANLVYCVCEYAAKRNYIERNTSNLYGHIYNAAPNYDGLNNDSIKRNVRSSLKIKTDEIVITYVGRVVFDKGVQDLIDAIKLNSSIANVRYLIVGDGEYLPTLRQKLEEEIKSNRVLLLGKRADVRDVLFASDIFIFPTLHENLSNSLLEACAAGLAIIATDVGGNPEVIENKNNGLLIPPNSPIEIANAIRKLVDNCDLRVEYGIKAKLIVNQKFNQNKIFEQFKTMYKSLIH